MVLIITLSIFWSFFPSGNYEPLIVLLSTLILILEFIRRVIPRRNYDKNSNSTKFILERAYHVVDGQDIWLGKTRTPFFGCPAVKICVRVLTKY